MTTLLGAAPLLKMFYSSLAAVVAIALVFSLGLLGAIKSADMRRSGRAGAAALFATLAVAGLFLSAALVVYGLVLVAHKS